MPQWVIDFLERFVGAAAGSAFTLFLMRNYLGSYLSEKGKNLATKEDIGKITDEIERVRNQYEKETEQLRFQLSTLAHTKNILYERRFTALEQIWRSLVALKWALTRLTAETGSITPGTPEAERVTQIANEFADAFRTALSRIENNEFLCPDETAAACRDFASYCLACLLPHHIPG